MCLGAFSKPKWTKINRNKKAQTTYVKKPLEDGILKYEAKNVLGLFYLKSQKKCFMLTLKKRNTTK